jgi:hypothetical protein
MTMQLEKTAVLSAAALSRNLTEIEAFRDVRGEPDMALGHQQQFFRRGDQGTFQGLSQDDVTGLSVAEIEHGLKSEWERDLATVVHEFRRHWLLGDLARTSKMAAKVSPRARQMQARALDVVRAMRGEATNDPIAKELATIMKTVSNKIRLAYNDAGGMIGELKDWAGPQAHNSFAVRDPMFAAAAPV